MRKIIMMNRVSIDGYFASLNEATFGMDWFIQDPEIDKFLHSDGRSDAKTLILGEITYVGFKNAWVPMLTDPNTPPPLKAVAQELTDMKKVVFSENIKESDWANSEFHDSNLIEVVKKLKNHDDNEGILIMGSGTVVQQLANEGLIDEYMFIVTPVVAGEGKPLFKDVKQFSLKLLETKSFDSGNVVLRYETVKKVN